MSIAEVEFFGQEGLPLKEALRRIQLALHENSCARSEGAWEKASLLNALGRVSAETVLANEAVPGFRASIMDGYALGQATIPKLGDQWHLVGRSSPGAAFEQKLKANEAIRILTGAPVPDGSDWVVPQELTQVCHQAEAENFRDILTLVKEASTHSWIRAADDELSTGQEIIGARIRLTPADLGRVASCGLTELKVWQQPRIGLLISGDELVAPGSQRLEGAIWESNGTLLETLLSRLGYPLSERLVVNDKPEALRSALIALSGTCDVVVSTGGMSVGDSDWIRPLVAELGQVDFWKLCLKPGRPFAFGWIGERIPFFGLPGNPVAAAITTLQLLWPAIQQLEGLLEPLIPPRLMVHLADGWQRKPGRPELARARLEVAKDGVLLAKVNGSQSSSRIGSLCGADLLLEIPAEVKILEPGTKLWAQLLQLPIF